MADRADSSAEGTALAADFAAVLDWWREAGVDSAFHDEPAQWLSPARPTADEAARVRHELRGAPGGRDDAPRPPAGDPAALDTSTWPTDVTLFAEWWLTEPWLDDGRRGGPGSGRVPPRGAKGATLMVMVPEPESEDTDRLLSGPQGRLLDAMLRACGIGPDEAYVASVLPRNTPMADWNGIAARGFAKLVDHHVGLVAPRLLMCFGSNILPLLGNEPANNRAGPGICIHTATNLPLLTMRSLAALLARPRWKAQAWQQWLDWTAKD